MPQDWTNIDLDSHEIDCQLIDSLTFDTFLMELSCNVPSQELTPERIEKEFLKRLHGIADEAQEIFYANEQNILNHAKKESETV